LPISSALGRGSFCQRSGTFLYRSTSLQRGLCEQRIRKETLMTRLRSFLLLLVVAALPLIGTPTQAAPPGGNYILCSCSLCKRSPDTICQISPTGYSILCSDWYATHC
jgi:hypothetical protein